MAGKKIWTQSARSWRAHRAALPSLSLLWACIACGTSPVDAVIAADAGAADAPTCDAASAGNVLLISRVTGTCLGQGAPTTVFGMPAYDTTLLSDCSSPLVQWQLTPALTPLVYYVRHVATGFDLDVRLAASAPGTSLILYAPTQLSNQRFLRGSRGAPYVDFQPQNAPGSCVQEIAGTVQIWPCNASIAPQEWVVQQQGCL